MKGRIQEVFDSVQGEGLYVGHRQIFVRMHGCNLSCGYCDTPQESYSEYDPEELFDEIQLYAASPFHSVSFTGGEPLLQKDFLKKVMQMNHNRLITNYLETNGTLPEALADLLIYVDVIAMDIKLPSSCGYDYDLWEKQKQFLSIAKAKETFVKVVIGENTIDLDIVKLIDLIREVNPGVILVLQPDSNGDQERIGYNLRRIQEMCRNVWITTCIVPQVHKAIGVK